MAKIVQGKAQYGEKMIELSVRFWTNKISKNPNDVVKKQCRESGVVYLPKNETHGIQPSKPIPFNSLLELAQKIEEALIKNGIKVKTSRRVRHYRI